MAKTYDAFDQPTRELLAKIEITYAFSMQRRDLRYVDLAGYEPGGGCLNPMDELTVCG